MREERLNEIRETVRRIADREQPDPLSRCIADQLAIVLNSLLGLEIIADLLACPEPG